MKNKPLLFACIAMLLITGSCENEKMDEVVVPKNAAFKTDVMPIFEMSCGSKLSSCHASGASAPDLSGVENAYVSLTESGYVTDTVNVEKNLLIQRMTNKSNPMPKSGILQQYQIDIVKNWISNGAQNN